jgi:hypothetical protein
MMRALFEVLGVSAGVGAGSCGGIIIMLGDDDDGASGSGSAVTGSPMMASAGLSGSLKSCASLSLSCMIGGCSCCCGSLLLFSCASLTPSCPPEIGLLMAMMTAAALALAGLLVGVMADGFL